MKSTIIFCGTENDTLDDKNLKNSLRLAHRVIEDLNDKGLIHLACVFDMNTISKIAY